MAKRREISQEQFEKLLNWLNPDKELAGIKYESIRLRLIKFFKLKDCHSADELADTSIDIIAEKIDSIVDNYKGDPALYFHGVAKKAFLTYKNTYKNTQQVELSSQLSIQDSYEAEVAKHECLESCLQRLTEEDRELIIAYYQESKRAKIKTRKVLADKKGISAERLRIHIYRLKDLLGKCVRACMKDDND